MTQEEKKEGYEVELKLGDKRNEDFEKQDELDYWKGIGSRKER